MDIGEDFFFEDDIAANWMPNIPYTLLRIKNDVLVFYKRRGNQECRRDINKADLHKYKITSYDGCRQD